MEQFIYERPREKVRRLGIEKLTTLELIQLVVGAGSANISGARLAREVHERVALGDVSYRTLQEIKGLGEAKICQLLAVFELGTRLHER